MHRQTPFRSTASSLIQSYLYPITARYGIRNHHQRLDATMSKVAYDSSPCAFRADDYPGGETYIHLQPGGDGLAILRGGDLFLKLRPWVDVLKAQALARELNELVAEVEHVRHDSSAP